MRKIFLALMLTIVYSGLLFADDNSLTAIKLTPLPDERVRVDFEFSAPIKIPPASFITQQPARLVLDFANVMNKLNQQAMPKEVKLGALNDYKILSTNQRIRAVLNLSSSTTYAGSIAGCVYSLILSGKSHQLYRPHHDVFVTNRDVDARFSINSIDFRGTGKQGGRIIVGVSDSSIAADVIQTGKQLLVKFDNTRLSKQLGKRYDVMDFQSPAKTITAEQRNHYVRLSIINQGDYGHFAYQVNKQFIIDIFPLSDDEIKKEKLKKKIFTGKLISLNFQKIQVRAVLELLAEFTGLNLVVSDKVSGDITLKLNDIPWDQALDIILKTNALDQRQVGNIIMIAPAKDLVDREKAALISQQEVINLSPLRSDLIQINYAKADVIATLIKDKNTSLLSKRGVVSIDARTNTIWIQDTGAQIEEIRALIKRLDVPVKQVLIEARIVDVTKDFERDLGIRFGVSKPKHVSGTLSGANQIDQAAEQGKNSGTAVSSQLAAANVTPFTDRLNLDLVAAPGSLLSPASVGVALAKLGNGILLDLELSALESEGRGEVIASPRLITTNQQAATIESGQEIPYQQSTSSGATAVAFKKAVLSLKVIPQITPDNKIMMELQINQDTPSAQLYNGVPSIITREIQTNVLVNNGQTIVLGGIYQRTTNDTVNRIPFLGSLPVVGSLFRNRTVVNDNEELLIFITPRIITNNLSITTVEGQGNFTKGVELDKFGKPVVYK